MVETMSRENVQVVEALNNVMTLVSESGSAYVIRQINKKIEECDSDSTFITIEDSVIYFDFEDDTFNFEVIVEDVQDIKTDSIAEMTISILMLKNGDVVMIHTFS